MIRADARKTMTEQLPLDFSHSATQRHRKERKRLARAEKTPATLFDTPSSFDVHLHSATEAVASITAGNPDLALHWLTKIVGPTRQLKTKRYAFPVAKLDRLAWVRPPITVTLDAATGAIARALWADQLGLKPLRVRRSGGRLLASSPRWPSRIKVIDAPWTAIAALARLDIGLEVDENAKKILLLKLGESGTKIASAGLSGSSVTINTSRPHLIEALNLPALSYAGEPGTGVYRMPLLTAERLLENKQIKISDELRLAITRANSKIRPLATSDELPWQLYPFQSRDAARALRILETTGGVLLAGDMGSGKTNISLTLIHHLDTWPLLVVAPLAAFSTWERELTNMGRSFHLTVGSAKEEWENLRNINVDAVVISYDRLFAFTELIELIGFKAIIADEIQRIRTPSSRRSRALRQLAGAVPYRIGLSGTPLTNTISDLLPIGSFLIPGEWRPRGNNKELDDMYPGDPVESIAEHLGSMMVRRRMTETDQRLPKRNDHRIYIELTAEQRNALLNLQAETEIARNAGTFDGNEGRMHAFARLQRMRQIINAPSAAMVSGPNPKIKAAIDLAEDFISMNRKGVIFCADRAAFRELGVGLDEAGIKWVGIWGATPPRERIENERKFKSDPEIKVVICTIQAGGESWSASPEATWLIATSYMYAPSSLAQMEARVYRMNSNPDGPDIEICYIHANAPGGSLDDRMVEILGIKKQLFAQVVDRSEHIDSTKVHYSMGDLLYLMTGERNTQRDIFEKDEKNKLKSEKKRRDHTRRSAHKNKAKNREFAADTALDNGEHAITFEQYQNIINTDDYDALEGYVASDDGYKISTALDLESEDDFDVHKDDNKE